jgi:hypothetical protein
MLTYKRDCALLLDYVTSNMLSLEGNLPTWKPVFLQSLQLAQSLNARNGNRFSDIFTVASKYCKNVCKINEEDPNYSVQ